MSRESTPIESSHSGQAIEDQRLLPFSLGRGEDGVLLIHGFTGTPHEMRYLGERLAEVGFRVRGARLTGHGLDPVAFGRAKADDWVRDCRHALDSLADCRRVYIAGLSMGALLTILLAAERPERISGIALIAPAFRFRGAVRVFAKLFQYSLARRLVPFVPKGASAVLDPDQRRGNPTLARVPTSGAVELVEVIARAEAAMPHVRARAMVIYSTVDPTVAPQSAALISERLGSRPVRLLRLQGSLHLLTIDRERDRVATDVASFFREAASPSRTPGT